ncbi:hypothetical protein TNCV_3849381 [Trichonephila clavipes]|uniref:Uncharacterized protein n=1 Tax=Trichonephila clavipes TaxID=2585209 RepID=A0A8X6V0K6_TRICX|nr:hypothetical protein TNCV_3849381 [Trichonephila clavipes]
MDDLRVVYVKPLSKKWRMLSWTVPDARVEKYLEIEKKVGKIAAETAEATPASYYNLRSRQIQVSFQLHRPGMTDELFKGGGVGVGRPIDTSAGNG